MPDDGSVWTPLLASLLGALAGAVAGGVATYRANLHLARRSERQQALRDLYYAHVHEIYDSVINLRDRARAGKDVATAAWTPAPGEIADAYDLERALREIEMVARHARDEDFEDAKVLHELGKRIVADPGSAANHAALLTELLNALARFNDRLGKQLGPS